MPHDASLCHGPKSALRSRVFRTFQPSSASLSPQTSSLAVPGPANVAPREKQIAFRCSFLLVLLLAPLACLSGCCLMTDGATRLAGEIGDASERLHHSSAASLEMKHRPFPWPDGPKGPYEIVLQRSLEHPRSGGALLVGDSDSRGYKNLGYNWGTTYHLRFVRVPRELSIRKKSGETTIVVLERRADGAVEVTNLR